MYYVSGDYIVKPLTVDLRPSYYLAVILVIASVASVVLLFLLPIPFWVICLTAALVVGACAYHVLKDAFRIYPTAWSTLDISRDNQLMITFKNGVTKAAVISPTTVVTGRGVVLNVRIAGSYLMRSTVLLNDSADTESLRRLRIWLLWASQDKAKRPSSQMFN